MRLVLETSTHGTRSGDKPPRSSPSLAIARSVGASGSDHHAESTCSTQEQRHMGLARGTSPLARLPHSLSLVRSGRRAVMGVYQSPSSTVPLPLVVVVACWLLCPHHSPPPKKRCQPLYSQVRTEAGFFVFGGYAPSPMRAPNVGTQ